MESEIRVLDHGFVALESVCASDLGVVNAARVSFNKRHEVLEKGDDKLIEFLMRNRHGTPFEHNHFCFRIKAPIFVFREWHRHRIGHSYNEWSARYSQLEPDFYIPSNVRRQVGKPGHYRYEDAPPELAAAFREGLRSSSEASYELYQTALDAGVAREQARLHLPVNIYSQMYWTCNARSLMAFLSLRNHESAQWEIRQYAIEIEKIFAECMPVTQRAFAETRIGP